MKSQQFTKHYKAKKKSVGATVTGFEMLNNILSVCECVCSSSYPLSRES